MRVLVLFCGFCTFVAANANSAEEGQEFEGDILLTAGQRRLIQQGQDPGLDESTQRGASKKRRWPGGIVPYTIDESLAKHEKAVTAIASAIEEWSKKTCIKFRRRTDEQGYVYFTLGRGCSSFVGAGGYEQPIYLGPNCWNLGNIAHEIGHALGFWHEQSRADRDDYVTIVYENIRYGTRSNFKKYGSSKVDSLNEPYDYGSIMHYSRKAFSKNGKETIVPRKEGVTIGQRTGLSPLDARQMNLMYNCGTDGTNPTGQPTGGPPPTQAPPPPKPGCRDMWGSKCSLWKDSVCQTGMKKFCLRTCRLC